MNRRKFLALGLLLTPLAAALSSCGKSSSALPAGMHEIKWDRDICSRCSMVISDRRFGAEMVGGPKRTVFKFDDIGCAIFWTRDRIADHPWMNDAATKLWVADQNSRSDDVRWLEARAAHYVTRTSPMAYNQVAVARPEAGSVDFPTMIEHVLGKGKEGEMRGHK
jgi:copper chaperone NosL